MTDRYENIRKALDVIDECADGTLLMTRDRCARLREAADTLRALLAERDALADALEAARKDAERYRWLRKGANDDIAVVRGLGAMDYGMSAVFYTYSDEIDGDDLDAAIDQARGKGLVPEPPEVG